MSITVGPVVRGPGEGDVSWLGGFPHQIKLGGQDSEGVVCVVECEAHRDDATPWHVHHRDDETFYVLEGEMNFHSGETSTIATGGTLVHLPRLLPHAFVVESERARFLVIGVPALEDQFFRAAGTPQPEQGPPDLARMARIAGEHGIEILGPPPR